MKSVQSNGRVMQNNNEIDLLAVARLVWKHIGIVILAAIALGVAAYAATIFLIAPTYESTFTVFVNNRTDTSQTTEITNADTSAASSLAQTYAEIMESRPLLEQAAKEADMDYLTDSQLSEMVSASIQSNTQLVNVQVIADSAQDAYTYAKALAAVAPDYLADIVEGTSMKIVTKPALKENQIAPSPLKNAVMGALIGFIIAVAIIIIIDIADTRVKSKEELERLFGYSVMGDIPAFGAEEN